MDNPLDGAHGSPEWVLDHSAANTELNYNEELSLVCQPVTMNLIVDQDGILQLVENENDSPQVPRRDDESEHQEGRKELRGRFSRDQFEACQEKRRCCPVTVILINQGCCRSERPFHWEGDGGS